MLAAQDPVNHVELRSLAALSVAVYPAFLANIAALGGLPVPFQTSQTLQAHPSYTERAPSVMPAFLTPGRHHFTRLEEHSLDPRQLAPALLAAVRQTSIRLLEHTPLQQVVAVEDGVKLTTGVGVVTADKLVSTLGAWSVDVPVVPRKGQMLSVRLPATLPLREVIRTGEVYIVPRTQGPRAGTAVIGATIEDAGFDTSTNAAALAQLRALAAELLPELGDERLSPTIDQWAGLRPATPDGLPVLGLHPHMDNHFLAAGHYRDGILLAPATARVMAELLCGEKASVDLSPFAPERFA